MADPLVARCLYSSKGYMIPLNQCMSYSELYEDIFRTFQFSPTDIIELQYSVPGCEVCFLRNDRDFQMLFCSARIHRTEVHKTYLSDEWISYIHHVGDKFHGATELLTLSSVRSSGICANVGTEGCDWHLRAFSSSANGCLYITELNNTHTCKGVVRTQKHKLLGSKVVKTCIAAEVSFNLSLKPREIMSKFKSTYGFDNSYKVALKVKHRAKEAIYGSDADTFSKLSWYKEAVLQSNPSSSFVLEVEPSSNRFQRLFVAYGGCVEGFKFCLPVLYVDGTFGKSIYKGQILSATRRNGNQGFYPLAICFCDSETDANWTLFFKHLKSLLEPQGRVITFISDRGVGLLSAFDKVFAGNPHLFCYKHLVANLASKYRGKGNSKLIEDVKQKFFKVAYSSTQKEYSFNLRLLRAVGGADIIDPFLSELPVENWCRAFYTSCRYGIMANGIDESFYSWIAIEHLMPVYCMLDQTRIKQMEMAGKRREEAECLCRFTGVIWIVKLIEDVKQKFFKVAYSSTQKEYSFNLRLLRAVGGADIIDPFLSAVGGVYLDM
ncbi:uncharacterized protein LOC112178077 [Rosa chinensis]|uniref:uncharacterized protein LOC112178077 n=1 Tax=Rosa chinensis TaxID=74649 RepID=UPI000D094C57|nr:uncharacterized protein LOC112178077 [Rosa chinensis]